MPRRAVKASLTEAVKGTRIEALSAIRDRIAAELEGEQACAKCGGSLSSNTAALSKQLVAVVEILDAIRPVEVSQIDRIAKQRARRRSTGASDGTTKSVKRGTGNGGAGGKRGAAS